MRLYYHWGMMSLLEVRSKWIGSYFKIINVIQKVGIWIPLLSKSILIIYFSHRQIKKNKRERKGARDNHIIIWIIIPSSKKVLEHSIISSNSLNLNFVICDGMNNKVSINHHCIKFSGSGQLFPFLIAILQSIFLAFWPREVERSRLYLLLFRWEPGQSIQMPIFLSPQLMC